MTARSEAAKSRLDATADDMGDIEALMKQVYPDYRVIDFTGRRGQLRVWREETKYRVWELLGRVRHPFGFHTMIPVEEWDSAANSIRFTGSVCWLCPLRVP